MHYIYFAEGKVKRFYETLVDRVEVQRTEVSTKEIEGEANAKGVGEVGSLLKVLNIVSLDIEATLRAAGKKSTSQSTTTEMTTVQKLKALLLQLESEGRLSQLSDRAKACELPEVGTSVIFSLWIKTDLEERSEKEIERTGAAILGGDLGGYPFRVQASLVCMESPNAWRRLESLRYIKGFGTLIGARTDLVEVDPIVFQYATEVGDGMV